MKSLTLKKTILLIIAFAGTGLAPAARADHVTNFLDPLVTEVSTRIDNADTNSTKAETRALNSASKILNRNTKTVSKDLSALGSAANVLDKAFPDDPTFGPLENEAVNNFAAEAQSELDAVAARGGTNDLPKALSNQLAQAQAALDHASEGSSNTIPVRARAVSFALNKIRAANNLANRLFKAPLSLDGTVVTLSGRESDHDAFDVTLNSDGTYVIPANDQEDEEDGTWSYERTSATTGTLTLTPIIGAPHTLDLKFSKSTKGTFTGQTSAGDETVKGKFSIASE